MIVSEEKKSGTEPMSCEIVWRNPLALVQARLRDKELKERHYGWAEQARKIRARRVS
jgi:hypothetical protein